MTRVPSTARVDVFVPAELLPWTGVNFSAGTGPVLVRQVTVAVSIIPMITQDIVVAEPFFTSLFTDSTSEVSFGNGTLTNFTIYNTRVIIIFRRHENDFN